LHSGIRNRACREFPSGVNVCLLCLDQGEGKKPSEQGMRRNASRGLCPQQDNCVARAMRRIGQVAALLGFWGAHPVMAEPSAHPPVVLPVVSDGLHFSAGAGPTWAWIRFCDRQPLDCSVDLSEPATIALTEDTWASLREVNRRVNGTIAAVSDQDHWGEVDRWDYPDDGLGDCEDMQLLKRKLLVEAGLPRRALRMTVVIDEQGAGHAVLRVRTDRGDLILDNKRDDVLPWRQTGYLYVKGEGADGAAWGWFGDQIAPSVTAAK
jgi:predicted transglutaminase-like cysteine proteinase